MDRPTVSIERMILGNSGGIINLFFEVMLIGNIHIRSQWNT